MLLPRSFFMPGALEVAPVLLGCVLEHDSPDGLVAVMLTEVEAYCGETDPASHAYHGRTARNAVMFGPPGHSYVYFTYGMHFCVNLVCMPAGTASAVLLRAGRVIEGAALAATRRFGTGAGTAGPGGALSPARERDLARGPARLCQALGITRSLNGADVCDPSSPLRVRPGCPGDVGQAFPPSPVLAGAAAGAVPVPGAARDRAVSPLVIPEDLGPASGVPSSPNGGDLASWHEPGHVPWLAGRAVSQGPRVGVSAGGDRPWRFWLTGDPSVSVYRPYTPRRTRQS